MTSSPQKPSAKQKKKVQQKVLQTYGRESRDREMEGHMNELNKEYERKAPLPIPNRRNISDRMVMATKQHHKRT